jgi:Ni/Co efflux regulator RcnB
MKKLIAAALAASVVATPALAQPSGYFNGYGHQQQSSAYHGQGNSYGYSNQWNANRKWAKGQRFDRRYARNYREIRNPRAYHLRDAPRGYHWVRSGNDAVLVAIAGGLIGAVLANAFN